MKEHHSKSHGEYDLKEMMIKHPKKKKTAHQKHSKFDLAKAAQHMHKHKDG
jgi:hypothetical protein